MASVQHLLAAVRDMRDAYGAVEAEKVRARLAIPSYQFQSIVLECARSGYLEERCPVGSLMLSSLGEHQIR